MSLIWSYHSITLSHRSAGVKKPSNNCACRVIATQMVRVATWLIASSTVSINKLHHQNPTPHMALTSYTVRFCMGALSSRPENQAKKGTIGGLEF